MDIVKACKAADCLDLVEDLLASGETLDQVTATISATVFAELSTGKAAAINVSGSLRMQSYWITVQVLRSGDIGRPPAELQQAVTEFESRLNSPLLVGGIPVYVVATRGKGTS